MEKLIQELRVYPSEPGDTVSERMQAEFGEIAVKLDSLRDTLERLDETVDRFLRGLKQRRQQSGGEPRSGSEHTGGCGDL